MLASWNYCKVHDITYVPSTQPCPMCLQEENRRLRILLGQPEVKKPKPIYFQCDTCKGTKEVPERDYVAMCGYSDCQGVIRKKEDAIEKKRWWRKHWTFKCPVCGKIFAEEKLIEWPMVPCPTCQ